MSTIFVKGERIRIAKKVGRGYVTGFEGVVDMQVESGVIVILDNDPAVKFRIQASDGFAPLNRPIIRRFFQLNEIEKI